MNPHIDDSGEINVFDAARYFSGYEMHGTFYKNHPIVKTQSILNAPDSRKSETNFVLRSPDLKKTSKAKEPTSPGLRLSLLFNSLFQKSNSKRNINKQKQLESPAVSSSSTPKSNLLSPKINKSLKFHSNCNDGYARELWRDRRLDGIRVVGKSWVLNNSADDKGLFCKILLGEELSENRKNFAEDDCSSSDASSDLFELENCN